MKIVEIPKNSRPNNKCSIFPKVDCINKVINNKLVINIACFVPIDYRGFQYLVPYRKIWEFKNVNDFLKNASIFITNLNYEILEMKENYKIPNKKELKLVQSLNGVDIIIYKRI